MACERDVKCKAFEFKDNSCIIWKSVPKGDGTTVGAKCGLKSVFDPRKSEYKKFVSEAFFIDDKGNKVYPKVKFVKMKFKMNAKERDPKALKMPLFEKIEDFIN